MLESVELDKSTDSDDRDRMLSFDRQALAHTEAENTRLATGM